MREPHQPWGESPASRGRGGSPASRGEQRSRATPGSTESLAELENKQQVTVLQPPSPASLEFPSTENWTTSLEIYKNVHNNQSCYGYLQIDILVTQRSFPLNPCFNENFSLCHSGTSISFALIPYFHERDSLHSMLFRRKTSRRTS